MKPVKSVLYIQRHNVKLGNHLINGAPPSNVAGEWWEVIERNGTRWTFGTAPGSEQIAPMAGYPGNNTGSWASLGYAGQAVNRVAARWRADRAVDVYGNAMTFTYEEETRVNATVTGEIPTTVWVPDHHWWGSATFGPGRTWCVDSNGNPTPTPPLGPPYAPGNECIPSTWGGYDGSITSCHQGPPCANGLRYNVTPGYWTTGYTTTTYTITYDKASYLKQIDYTSNIQAGAPPEIAAGVYSIVFEREARPAAEGDTEPLPAYNWNNWDNDRLRFVRVRYTAPGGGTPADIRVYELKYAVRSYGPDDGKSWKTTVLTEVHTTGSAAGAGPTYAPKVSFTYTDLDNRANCGSGCQEWKYPRLHKVYNGWGGEATFTYSNDGRGANSWYNWRVNTLRVGDGVSANLLRTDFSYSNACYKNPDAAVWSCTSGDQTELVGYGQTTVTTRDFDGATVLGIAVHKFHTDQQKQGRAYEVEYKQPDGAVLAKTTTTYTVVTSGLPANGFFTFASAVESFTRQDGALKRITRSEYGYDSATGNLLWAKDYDGVPATAALYRQTEYEYNTNTNTNVWILDRVWKQTVKDAGGVILSEQRYAYDNAAAPAATVTTVGAGIQAGAAVTASSQSGSSYAAAKVIDGIIGQNNVGEWASQGELNPWIQLTWASPQTISRVRLYDRVNTTDWARGGVLIFSDGSTVGIPPNSIPNDGAMYEITFQARSVTWVKFQVVGGSGLNVGLSEFQVFTGATTPVITKGALTLTKTVQPNGTTASGATTLDSTFSYDAYGNLTESRTWLDTFTTTAAPTGSNYQAVAIAYDPTGTYPVSSTLTAPGLLSRTTTTAYFYDSGLVQYTIDANGGKTSTAYDGLGRVVGLTYPGYEQPAYNPAGYAGFNVQYLYPAVSAGGAVTAPFGLEMRVWDELASTPQYRSAWAIYDGLGRTLQIQGPDQDGNNLIVADTEYNALGLVKRASRPRLVTGAGGAGQYQTPSWAANTFTSNAYDALGRLLTTTFPDGSVSTTIYNGLRTTFVDRNLHQKVQEVNAFGQLVKVEEYTGTSPSFTLYATTTYHYNTRGLLTQVTDAAGNLTTITYNALGQKTAMNDPDMGNWTYAYDPLGNLQTQTDARGCVTTLTYDSLNRLTGKTYSGPGGCDPTPDVTYTYDTGPNGLGRRTGMTDGSGSTAWEYDRLGRMVKTTQILTGAPSPYTTEYTFDAFGRPRTQKYPDSNELLTFYYNAMGLLNRVDTDTAGQADYVWGLTYNEAGQVKNETLGNGVTQEFCYQSTTLRLTAIRAYTGPAVGCGASPSNLKLHLSYQYDSGGNVTQLGDATRSETTTYTYDALDRLTNVLATSGTTTAFQKAWTYDPTGNMTSFSQAGASAIEAGTYHTCAVTASGGVKCWGRNNSGQIGDGTFTNRTTPVNVSGLISGITAIASGGDHSCALTTDGAVKCWGRNSRGQLGDGTTTTRTTPTNVAGLSSGVVAITAGHDFTCALTSSGGVKCWGGNGNGQLGDGTVTSRTSPVDVSGLAGGVTAISAGQQHVCALLADGSVKCWGFNRHGQIGDGSTTTRKTPVAVYGLSSGIAAITAGAHHSCAVTTAGAVTCWGNNANGQLGDGTTTNRAIPVSVSGLSSGVAAITAGLGHVCALTTAGAVNCWGQNSSGQVGDGTTTNRLTPVSVTGLASGVTLIAGGGLHNCALLTTAQVKCWGGNGDGAIGDGTTTNRPTPVSVNVPYLTTTYTYPAPGSARPHAVTALSSGESFAYDANGNMTSRVEGGLTYQQNFDAENRLTSIIPTTGAAVSFKYNGDGTLVAKLVGNVTTYYIGGVYEVEVTNTTITKKTWYYPAGGAIRVEDLVNSANSGVFYILKDHLGSASVTLDSNGTAISESRYYPFGETRVSSGTIPTDKRFQSQRDVGLGLMHFGARFYHPKLGRFISADTIVPNFADPQALNRYAFVLNNPLKYVDPTGHMAMCKAECEAAGGAYGVSSSGTTLTYLPKTQEQQAIAKLNATPVNTPTEEYLAGPAMEQGCGCGVDASNTTQGANGTIEEYNLPATEQNVAVPVITVGSNTYYSFTTSYDIYMSQFGSHGNVNVFRFPGVKAHNLEQVLAHNAMSSSRLAFVSGTVQNELVEILIEKSLGVFGLSYGGPSSAIWETFNFGLQENYSTVYDLVHDANNYQFAQTGTIQSLTVVTVSDLYSVNDPNNISSGYVGIGSGAIFVIDADNNVSPGLLVVGSVFGDINSTLRSYIAP